jgi:hypothetical protein
MRKLIPVFLAVVACGPSLKPAMVERTSKMVSELSGKGDQAYDAPDAPAGSQPKPFPWAVGQWVAYKVTNDKHETSVMKFSIVGKEPRGWWMETENQTGYARDVSKMLFAKMPGEVPPEQIADLVLVVVSRHDDDEIQTVDLTTLPPFVASMNRAIYKQTLAQSMAQLKLSMQRDAVTVAAGTFRGAYRVETPDTVGYWHPLVPINGTVKSGTAKGDFSMELIGFGMDAKSALP